MYGKIQKQQKYREEIDRLKEIKIDEVAIQSLKKSKKLTSKASKTKNIQINVQVSDQLQHIGVKIVDPLGSELPVNDETTKIRYERVEAVPVPHAFIVSPEFQLTGMESRRTVEIIYKAKSKLRAGVYRIFISGNDQSLANTKLRLD